MISKLKEACGFEYTNKLQRMFQDIQTSKDLMASYKDFSDLITDSDENTKSVEASYAVLASGMWPLTPPNTTFIPPQEVVQTYERFQSFYNSKHSGRKLSWLWHLCKGEIKANYIKSSKVPYIFQVSTYQMGILLLFNDNERVTYDEIQQTTQLAPDWLNPQLGVFVKAKVLLAEPEGAKMESGTTYALNYNFRNKKMKVNLQIAVKSNAKAEVEDTHKTIEEDRKLLMQVSSPCFVFTVVHIANHSLVRHCAYHEIPQEDEARSACAGDDQPDQVALQPQDPRHQEEH
jgi:cullin 1